MREYSLICELSCHRNTDRLSQNQPIFVGYIFGYSRYVKNLVVSLDSGQFIGTAVWMAKRECQFIRNIVREFYLRRRVLRSWRYARTSEELNKTSNTNFKNLLDVLWVCKE